MTHPARSIVHALLDAAEAAPERPAVRFGDERLDYAALLDLARRWSGAFVAWGLRPGDRAALFLDNSPRFLGCYFGVQLAGGIVVLVNTQYRQVELSHILSDAGVRLCVTDSAGRAELRRVEAELAELETIVVVGETSPSEIEGLTARPSRSTRPVDLTESEFLSAGASQPIRLPDSSDVALIAYTSGTTGRSKGAMLSHGNLVSSSAAVVEAWRWTSDDQLLLTLPLFHIHGLGVGVHGSIVARATIDLRVRFDASDVFETLIRGQTTMFFGVPTMYGRLLAEAQRRGQRPPPIRLYVSGSAALSVQTFEDFAALYGQRILERYGMTETIMNLTNPYEGERRPGTVGQPFPSQEARIVDLPTRQPILDERYGEIQVRGPHVFKGYWRRQDATDAAFDADGWFNTGDLGWRSADGYFTISGRARELIITGGYNVYPREVEEVLVTHQGVAEAAVLGMPDAEFGEQIVAVVVRRDAAPGALNPASVTADELVALCRDQLASYKKPRQVHFVDSLPRNALGKVQKHLIKERIEESGRMCRGV